MSIDPAIKAAAPGAFESHDQLVVKPGGVYLFDFDGVMSSRFEDDIYRLPAIDDEIETISAAAEHFGIRCERMEQRYQRHLIYQAAAWKLELPIEPGPGFAMALEASNASHFFILTARSGWHAVERLRLFLKARKIQPIEIYNVGRVIKDRQVDLICREFSPQEVVLIDDSAAHLEAIAPSRPCNLRLVHVQDVSGSQPDERRLRDHFRRTVRTAMAAS